MKALQFFHSLSLNKHSGSCNRDGSTTKYFSRTTTGLLEGPALAPPPGVLPNFTDPPNLRRTGVVALLVTLVLSTLAVTMRTYTRGLIMRQVRAADCSTILSLNDSSS